MAAPPPTMASEAQTPSVPTDMEAYMRNFQKAFANTNNHVQALPDDLKFEASMDRSFAKRLTAVQERLRALTGNLLEVVAKENKALIEDGASMKSRKGIRDEDEDMFAEFSGHVQDVIDSLMEQTNIELDIHSGKRKQPAPSPATLPEAPAPQTVSATLKKLPPGILYANIPKPQAKFDIKVDNSASQPPWRPTLAIKAHQMVPLEYRSTTPPPAEIRVTTVEMDVDTPSLLSKVPRVPSINPEHPYSFETKHLPYPSSLFTVATPIEPKSFAETPYTYVHTPEQYSAMVAKLLTAKEIAVDLEYHSMRSFTGFLCLMQISTREEDFVVDLLTLRKELREDKLGGVMVDPSIVKVFHGADSDILWLQQDFDIYVVCLFDTYHATKVLQYPSHSLASLLQLYCNFTADKRYQMADWRIRPLPEDMVHYARSDTHFLLFVFDHLRNTLIERSGGTQTLIRQALAWSEDTATKLHQRVVYDAEAGSGPNGWRSLANKVLPRRPARAGDPEDYMVWGPGEFGYQTERIFKRVHAWRDSTARAEDESVGFVLGNQVLWALACRPPTSVLALAPLLPYNHTLARALRNDLFEVIKSAREEGSRLFAEDQAKLVLVFESNLTADQAMDVDGEPSDGALAPIAIESITSGSHSTAVNLWAGGNSEATPTTTSSLFSSTLGSTSIDEAQAVEAFATVTSGLFGSLLQVPTGLAVDLEKQHKEAFVNVIRKFNASAVVAAVAVHDPMASNSNASASVPAPHTGSGDIIPLEDVPAPTQPEQIAYVRPEKKDRDAVVQVSKPKQKRKRAEEVSNAESSKRRAETTDTDDANASAASSAAKTKPKKERKPAVKAADVPEFSYANESNSLDIEEKDENGAPRKKKVKQAKKPIVDTSGFKMPPQDPQDKLSGNRARTF